MSDSHSIEHEIDDTSMSMTQPAPSHFLTEEKSGQEVRADAVSPAAPHTSQRDNRLSGFLKLSIILLAVLTVASISLLFVGDAEGKFERVFSTFAVFAVFVLFTSLDTKLGRTSHWYAPVALIANAYILGLLLIVIWMTEYQPVMLMWQIFWNSLFVIFVTRLVIFCCQLLLKFGVHLPFSVSLFAFITSVGAVVSGILFTAPTGIKSFDLIIPDLYWKIATAMLILTALGLSVTFLLRWFYTFNAREHSPQQHTQTAQAAPSPVHGGIPSQHVSQQAVPVSAAAVHVGGRPLLPWPTYPDGRPVPVGPDGQPDLSVLQSEPGRS